MEITKSELQINVDNFFLYGDFNLVKNSKGIIIFAHGSGSSRLSSRNKLVSDILNRANFSTLLFDLLTVEEEIVDAHTLEFRFNISLLADRLIKVSKWLKNNNKTDDQKIGYFGASTGAAAALIAAAKLQKEVSAVVSRGGRPDLAHEYLGQIHAPTLLIIGELDYEVIRLNRLAYSQLSCERELTIVPQATHLFEEESALEEVAYLAQLWFSKYM